MSNKIEYRGYVINIYVTADGDGLWTSAFEAHCNEKLLAPGYVSLNGEYLSSTQAEAAAEEFAKEAVDTEIEAPRH